jgi:nucleotide-binding universal stress UspA family protein
MIERILCPVDMSDTSRVALERAIPLAERTGAAIDVLHAYHVPRPVEPVSALWMTAGEQPVWRVFEERARVELEQLLASLTAAERDRITAHLTHADPPTAILSAAQRLKSDLIVMGTHGRTGLSRFILGSVAERVVRESNCPVLTVRRPSVPEPAALRRFERTLVPVDFSACSVTAVHAAAAFARAFGGKLDLVHFWDVSPMLSADALTVDSGMVTPGLTRAAKVDAEQGLAEFLRRVGSQRLPIARTRIERGNPARAIVTLAERGDYDLVALGTHGRTGLSRLLLGSVAEHVVRRCRCPVLTVREPRRS